MRSENACACLPLTVARLTVYVPDELADEARARGLNISVLTRVAIAAALERTSLPGWLGQLPRATDHDSVMTAVDDASE